MILADVSLSSHVKLTHPRANGELHQGVNGNRHVYKQNAERGR